jgi:hypothetical protein
MRAYVRADVRAWTRAAAAREITEKPAVEKVNHQGPWELSARYVMDRPAIALFHGHWQHSSFPLSRAGGLCTCLSLSVYLFSD